MIISSKISSLNKGVVVVVVVGGIKLNKEGAFEDGKNITPAVLSIRLCEMKMT